MSTCTHSWQANRCMKCPPTHVDVPPVDTKQVQGSMLSVCLGLALSYVKTRKKTEWEFVTGCQRCGGFSGWALSDNQT